MDRNQVTLADVAEVAQVSKMSVSRALNGQSGVSEKTRQHILKVAEKLGYNHIAALHPPVINTKTIGLLIPEINTVYMGEILQGVCGAAERLNCSLMLHTQGATEVQQYLSNLNQNVDGVLMVVPHDYEVIVNHLENRNLSYVIIDHHSGTDDEPSVTATNRKGTIDAMRHLLALGHRRIGFITGRMDITCSIERLQGYQDGLAEIDLPYDNDLVREGDYSQPSGFHHAKSLLDLDRPPTALVVSNDVMAFGAMDAAKAAGLTIGRDISIIGFDDIFMSSQVYPTLTSIRQPMADMGEVALELLYRILEGHKLLTVRRELPTELVIRESTGPAPERA